jgi:hypothetical protein
VKADCVGSDATLDFWRAHGLDKLVDGYGFTFIQARRLLPRGWPISSRMGWSNASRREAQKESHVGLRNGDSMLLAISAL